MRRYLAEAPGLEDIAGNITNLTITSLAAALGPGHRPDIIRPHILCFGDLNI
jgi:hypothetical protein